MWKPDIYSLGSSVNPKQYQNKFKNSESQQQRENLESNKKTMTHYIEGTTIWMMSDFSLENMKIERQCI